MNFIKKILVILLLFFGTCVTGQTLKAGVSIDSVPKAFYGTWRVVAKIDKQTGNRVNFKPNTIDVWNLSRSGNVINLNNPFTGASASVTVDYVDGKIMKGGKRMWNMIATAPMLFLQLCEEFFATKRTD